MTKKRTLIIGGGEAGAKLAHLLAGSGERHITLVDAKDFFEIPSATLRGVLEPETIGSRIRKAYRDFVRAEFVQAKINELRTNEAVLDNGKTIPFDEVVIATGSAYAEFPLVKPTLQNTLSEREAYFKDEHARIAAAGSVLVLGGGAVGVELAGEIKFKYPEKAVTIYEAKSELVSNFHPKASAIAKLRLEELGVKLLFNGTGIDEGAYDLVYRSIGTSPNTGFMKAHFSRSLNERGAVKVDPFFKVEGTSNVYAIGDVTAIPEAKQGMNALGHAGLLAKNLLKPWKAKPYKPAATMALITLGRKHGVAQMPFGVTKAKFFVNLKQKDLFIDMLMGQVGAKNKG